MTELRHWVEIIKDSIPDHSKDIKLNLDAVSNRSPLSVEDTHACALVAALAAGNGELAYAIMTSGELDNFTAEMVLRMFFGWIMGGIRWII